MFGQGPRRASNQRCESFFFRIEPHKFKLTDNFFIIQKILFYRDGVSEGQLVTVLEAEIPAIKAACRELDPKYNPKLLYVVCAKR